MYPGRLKKDPHVTNPFALSEGQHDERIDETKSSPMEATSEWLVVLEMQHCSIWSET